MSGLKDIRFIWHLFVSFPDKFVMYGVTIESPIESPMVSPAILNSPGSKVQDEPYHGFHTSITQTFIQLSQIWGNVCGGNDCECAAICPSTTIYGATTPNKSMSWTWNTVWKVLQSQSYHSGVVSALTSPMDSASSPKSGETSVLVMVWVCSHMPIHHNWRCSNTLYAYDVNVECSLKGSTVSTIS
jgi:hypothetical protein